MESKLLVCFIALACLATTNCDHSTSLFPEDGGQTLIRIENASQYDFENVEINPYDSPARYGTVRKGKKTGYKAFARAYRYAYVRLFIDGKEFIIQPIDYVGETPLGPGFFTYILEVADFRTYGLTIRAVKDN